MKDHKTLIVMIVFFMLSFTAFPTIVEAGSFDIMVLVGDNNSGPKTDPGSAHLKDILKNLGFNNFSIKRVIPVQISEGKEAVKQIGFNNINAHIKLINVKNNVATVQISFTSGGTTYVQQTLSLPKGKNYTFVRPVEDKCVVVIVTFSRP